MSDHRPVSIGRKVAYGFGSVAFGVKSNGFDYFFLIFYSQVMGVSAYLVSLALMIALIVDALSDPLIDTSRTTRARAGADAIHLCMRLRYRPRWLTTLCGIRRRGFRVTHSFPTS